MNSKNGYMLEDEGLRSNGYDWWWHSFTGVNAETGEERSFFIEYYVINPGLGDELPVYGQLERNRMIGRKPSYAMVKAGSWGKNKSEINNMYAIKDFTHRQEPFRVQIGDNILENNFITGRVRMSEEDAYDHPEYMSDSGDMTWCLMLYKNQNFDVGYGASSPFRKAAAFDMFWHVEGLNCEYDGYVDYNGFRYMVTKEKSYGYQDKNWGRDYTSPWVWLNCNNLRLKGSNKRLANTCFDFGGGRPVVLGKAIDNKILGIFVCEGRRYEFNFSKFLHSSKQEYKCKQDGKYIYWYIKCQNNEVRLAISFRSKISDMLKINYEAPSGEKKHNNLLNGGMAYGSVKLYYKNKEGYVLTHEFEGSHGGCEYGVWDD